MNIRCSTEYTLIHIVHLDKSLSSYTLEKQAHIFLRSRTRLMIHSAVLLYVTFNHFNLSKSPHYLSTSTLFRISCKVLT